MRGQAHVAFRDVQASTQAMRALQGFDFFGKEMVRYPPLGPPSITLCAIEQVLMAVDENRIYNMPKGNPI